MDTFRERLKHTRTEKRMSQADLAVAVGKSGKAVISSWEVGNAEPSLTDLRKLADALGTTACYLIDGFEDGKAPVLRVAPEGYSLIANTELIDLQRRALKVQE